MLSAWLIPTANTMMFTQLLGNHRKETVCSSYGTMRYSTGPVARQLLQ